MSLNQASPVTKQFVFEFYDKCTEGYKAKCKSCGKEIREQIGVTSNFVSHLKVSLAKPIKLCMKHFLRGRMGQSGACSNTQTGISEYPLSVAVKYNSTHPR